MLGIERHDILIVGAGLAGLTAARVLVEAGRDVVVIDKGRGVGGRLANRRFAGRCFDHGAQFLTVRDPAFRAMVEAWEREGIATPWYESDTGHVRYRGVPAMTAIAKRLGEDVDVRLGTQVASIQQEDCWRVRSADGNEYAATALLLTPPVPQSLELLSQGKVMLDERVEARLARLTYEKCFAVMAALDEAPALREPGWFAPSTGSISWIADNQAKGISDLPAVTIHATAAFSEARWMMDREEAADLLIKEASEWLTSRVIDRQIHRWRYSKPIQTADVPAMQLSETPRLIIAGDAFGGPRVEGAALSGMAAADMLLQGTPQSERRAS